MKSKFSIAQTILVPGYLILATFGLGILIAFVGLKSLMNANYAGFWLIAFSLIFLALGILSVRHYLLLINQITIDESCIEIKGLLKHKVYQWSEVKSIKLTGKQNEKFLFTSMPMEAISIVATTGEKEVIFTKFYSNMHRIRTALYFINLKLSKNEEVTSECFMEIERQKPKVDRSLKLTKYSGISLLCFNGIMAYGSIIFVFWTFPNSTINLLASLIVSALVLAYGLLFYGYQLHYFEKNDQILVVKNHVWFWREDAYYLADLREVVFETPHKMSTSMRVITNNYESKLYPAGSLRNKTWSRFRNELKEIGIRVRNEAHIP